MEKKNCHVLRVRLFRRFQKNWHKTPFHARAPPRRIEFSRASEIDQKPFFASRHKNDSNFFVCTIFQNFGMIWEWCHVSKGKVWNFIVKDKVESMQNNHDITHKPLLIKVHFNFVGKQFSPKKHETTHIWLLVSPLIQFFSTPRVFFTSKLYIFFRILSFTVSLPKKTTTSPE